jgi:Ni,Fe-hydrogenase III small subunit/Pyruvate/2-oxoacid:ferredoxin oxidoreductase delta subunit
MMIKTILTRLQQKNRTVGYPNAAPTLPDRFRGWPTVASDRCSADCQACRDVCPTDAISFKSDLPKIDLGRCLFCGKCAEHCPTSAIEFTKDYRLAADRRDALIAGDHTRDLKLQVSRDIQRLFGRSLKLRQVSAGGCNACEADINVLTTVVFDLGRFGIQFVASPRHADGLLITGPVTANMESALKDAYDAVPDPKLVIAVGVCAISGGIYRDHPETRNGVDDILPVDLYIPGCPPHPITILEGLLRLLGRLDDSHFS